MTIEEGKKAVAELKSEGYNEEEILASFYAMFANDEIDIHILEALTHIVGYELTDEFKNMSPEYQKTKGYEEREVPNAEEKTEEINEAAEEQGKEEETELEEGNGSEETEETGNEEGSEGSEEDEKKKAMKLFGLGKEDK